MPDPLMAITPAVIKTPGYYSHRQAPAVHSPQPPIDRSTYNTPLSLAVASNASSPTVTITDSSATEVTTPDASVMVEIQRKLDMYLTSPKPWGARLEVTASDPLTDEEIEYLQERYSTHIKWSYYADVEQLIVVCMPTGTHEIHGDFLDKMKLSYTRATDRAYDQDLTSSGSISTNSFII